MITDVFMHMQGQGSEAEVVSGVVVLIGYQSVRAITAAITVALLKDKEVKINGRFQRAFYVLFVAVINGYEVRQTLFSKEGSSCKVCSVVLDMKTVIILSSQTT